VQRRHQKLIEEAPAPFLPDQARTAMGEAAARLAAEAGYRSAGTVEFLYSPAGGEFFFLEMNTRLQVEHGVTELVTGLDLVERRLAVAAGAPLGLTQDDVRIRGHAIEVRLAAEDPQRQFLPVPGAVTGLHVPSGPWLRADFGVAAGDRVPAEYDSLFGKLMAWGPDRESARRRLAAALGELRVSGLPSTASYLRGILTRPEFAAGAYSTTTLEERWLPQPEQRPAADQGQPGPDRPDSSPARAAAMTARTVQIRTSAGPFRIVIHGQPGTASAVGRAGRGAGPRSGPRTPAAAGQPAAPMDGVVVKVGAACGDEVERHAVLVVLEAMKMQIPVTAPWPGRVTALLVAEGDSVTAGQPLAEVSLPPEPDAP
jgi:acetyl-CoA/propionyl-CoA carboxylase biotin carboxyl carrier protein